ncbi:hypothetical protein [Maridesulfovibrio ferrireducens]|uniref:hypothetical protein n=1 Tax=Maridesulfovibrio ferrireducens TaxID=246191 RepID=UPI001A352442|nr:hypothetical protein [Maridesulfovibrio ferrireducens]MBI9113141.1 hypothetical protein [Maridesulfovibrio ferrireducens]
MYTDHYLKFASEDELKTVYALPTEDSEGVTYPYCSIDVVGRIVSIPAEIDEDDNIITEAVYCDGWHVNVRCLGDLPDELTPFEIEAPNTPARVWAQ